MGSLEPPKRQEDIGLREDKLFCFAMYLTTF